MEKKKLSVNRKNKPATINPREIKQSFITRMEESLEEQGVTFLDEDRLNINADYLHIPSNLSDVTSRELGEHLNAFTQQKIYMRTVFDRLSFKLLEDEREYKEKSLVEYGNLTVNNPKMSEVAKNRLLDLDPLTLKAKQDYENTKQQHINLENIIASLEDAIFLFSREVTRRNADIKDYAKGSI